ncbi:MAG TPA: glutaredoxin domain-containing protein [Gaiellaceae bacterium]|nr:glutaredoxin domain-containing protein [Gaiellaceae bacterium]
MLELWQTEWCRASHRVRERLTELGIDFVAHQVPVRREEREELVRATGATTIPVLVLDGGETLVGEEAIGAYLDGVREPPGAETHRLKAAKARRRYLEEACEC